MTKINGVKQKFVVGARVKDVDSDDTGVITRPYRNTVDRDDDFSSWWVLWDNGPGATHGFLAGEGELWSYENDMIVISPAPKAPKTRDNPDIIAAISLLQSNGFVVGKALK